MIALVSFQDLKKLSDYKKIKMVPDIHFQISSGNSKLSSNGRTKLDYRQLKVGNLRINQRPF
jgi:hypothetical protein